MDRRKRRSREAIFGAFSSLLERKRYDHITVQEIIDAADVGRSTFYAHFDTKDALLRAMCSGIFDHIFEGNLCEYTEHGSDLEAKLAHVLWHLRSSHANVRSILMSDSSELFMGYFREQLKAMFQLYVHEFEWQVPREYLLMHLVGSFAETVRWWLREGMQTQPETVARYFMTTMGR